MPWNMQKAESHSRQGKLAFEHYEKGAPQDGVPESERKLQKEGLSVSERLASNA
jgi:hypothetical protein